MLISVFCIMLSGEFQYPTLDQAETVQQCPLLCSFCKRKGYSDIFISENNPVHKYKVHKYKVRKYKVQSTKYTSTKCKRLDLTTLAMLPKKLEYKTTARPQRA